MGIHLLKFSACLFILLAFYKLFFENLHIHKFKRVYLLGALVLSALIPFITFTEYITIVPTEVLATQPNIVYKNSLLPLETKIDYTSSILWTIYGIGVFLFTIKFVVNLVKIKTRIKRNPKQDAGIFKHILLKERITPHTFFNYIFLNRKKYKTDLIPQEVFWHEETHAKQKHSIDVLFIEVLQIVLWFNPLIYIAKHAIKLNHEFLADQGVLQKGVYSSNYQKILLEFLNPSSKNNHNSTLVNAINYSSFKKRFTIMKTKTSKKATLIRSLFLLPLLALVIYGFSEKETIEIQKSVQESNETISGGENFLQTKVVSYNNSGGKSPSVAEFNSFKNKEDFALWVDDKHVDNNVLNDYLQTDFVHFFNNFVHKNARSKRFPQEHQVHLYTESKYAEILHELQSTITIHINKNGQLLVQSNLVTLKELPLFLLNLNNNLSKEQREKVIRANIITANETPKSVISDVEKILIDYGVVQVNIVGREKIQYPKPNSASKEQVAEYNKLAKHYNDMSRNTMRIHLKDVERLEYIYDLMSSKQKQDAEPFPDFPEPPPPPKMIDIPDSILPPPAPKVQDNIPQPPAIAEFYPKPKYSKELQTLQDTYLEKSNLYRSAVVAFKSNQIGNEGNLKSMYNGLITHYNEYKALAVKEEVFIQPIPALVPFKKKISTPPVVPMVAKGELSNIPLPPPPPAPLDYIIAMAKKGAVFYLENEKISSDRAIELVKKNKNLNIHTTTLNKKQPVVKITN